MREIDIQKRFAELCILLKKKFFIDPEYRGFIAKQIELSGDLFQKSISEGCFVLKEDEENSNHSHDCICLHIVEMSDSETIKKELISSFSEKNLYKCLCLSIDLLKLNKQQTI